MMKNILTIIILISSLVSCSSQKINTNEDYEVINLLLDKNISINNIKLKKKNFIYLRKDTKPGNDYLASILYEKFIDGYRNYNPGYYVDKNEIVYLKSQLNGSFFIDFSKIKSPIIKEYIKPVVKEKNDTLFVGKDFYADLSKIKYGVSKPIYSSNKEYAFIFDVADQITIFRKEKNKWFFYKNISLGIY